VIIGVPAERAAGERRVALVPELVAKLTKAGQEVIVESGAGQPAGFSDPAYTAKGSRVEKDVFTPADVVLKVLPPTADEIGRMREKTVLIGFLQPHTNTDNIRALAARNVTAFAMELMPRIARAQSMDALSAMSTVAGYKAVLMAANRVPKFFPLLMTAAGTISAARVLILGAGVAGLQAIGTARRLGAIVEAYDVRPAVKEQVESLGATFVDLGLETRAAEERTGYARVQSEDFYRQQQERLAKHLAAADVVITTALVPGQRAPVLVTGSMVEQMQPGSVIVDLAAEQGGNCALTSPGQEVSHHDVLILGPLNVPSTLPFHASQMYARTLVNYLLHLLKEGTIELDMADPLTREPLVTYQGEILFRGAGGAPSGTETAGMKK
jgi:NAD(P) transhydrogenase subunit alpha